MASPTVAGLGTNSSKTAGTTLAVTNSSQTFAVGDVLVAHLAMDPTAGSVTFGAVTNFGAWATNVDISNGSGSAGVRCISSWCICTTAFTGVTTINYTHPSVTSRSGWSFGVFGCDLTTPVRGTGTLTSSTTTSAVSVTATAGSSFDGTIMFFDGIETATGVSITWVAPAGFTTVYPGGGTGTMSGTTGGSANTNISAAVSAHTKSGINASDVIQGGESTPSGTQAFTAILFSAPVAAAGNYGFVGTVTNSASAAITSFSFTSHTVGNFALVEVSSFSGTRTATSLSSSNATWAALGTPYTSTAGPGRFQVFIGTVTSVATATVTIAWGAGTAGTFESASGFEFSTTVGIPVLDVQTHLDNGGGQAAWPSLTPAANGELYFGYSFNTTATGTTSTPGYIGTADAGNNGFAYNLNCAAAVATAPTWSDAGQMAGIMVLVRPAGAAAGILPQQLKKRMPAVFTRLITQKQGGVYSR